MSYTPRTDGIITSGNFVPGDVIDLCYDLEKQLAERDAALARCVDWLNRLANGTSESAQTYRNFARNKLQELPTSAQATAKVLVAARACAALWESYERGERERDDLEMEEAEVVLREAIREEQEGK